MSDQLASSATVPSRREFLKSSSMAALGTSLAGLASVPAVHAQGSDEMKVALIGCGGRGRQAAINAMRADSKNRLTCIADAFGDQLEAAKSGLLPALGPQYQVKE